MSECRLVNLKEIGVSKEVFDKIYSMGEQDGRADAIAEFLKMDNDCGKTLEECPNLYTEISCVECIAGKIEENKNDD